jgi:hypothetical protein
MANEYFRLGRLMQEPKMLAASIKFRWTEKLQKSAIWRVTDDQLGICAEIERIARLRAIEDLF